mmetsp:Transcript_29432/g.77140  ORF Transcript_29432/g.77140 Transcript_29432/m.77140 type:complete len:256 (-) Transcript_29432:619-1386(-)
MGEVIPELIPRGVPCGNLPHDDTIAVDVDLCSVVTIPAKHLRRHPQDGSGSFGHCSVSVNDPNAYLLHIGRGGGNRGRGGAVGSATPSWQYYPRLPGERREDQRGSAGAELPRSAKVGYFGYVPLTKKDVGRFQVAVNNGYGVKVLHALGNLERNRGSQLPWQPMRLDILQHCTKAAQRHQLSHNKRMARSGRAKAVKLEEVWVVQPLQRGTLFAEVPFCKWVHHAPVAIQSGRLYHLDGDAQLITPGGLPDHPK